MTHNGKINPADMKDKNVSPSGTCSVDSIDEFQHYDDYDIELQNKRKHPLTLALPPEPKVVIEAECKIKPRETWGSGIEFLMSCIAMSVGLGNIWRFPFVAYENGGGAFLIPYIIVLFLIGKPFYYLEVILGQFFNKSCVKIWAMVPGFRGVGWAQMYAMAVVSTYYCAIMSITFYYVISSFQPILPWSSCLLEWGDNCTNSDISIKNNNTALKNITSMKSSAELYFVKSVLKEKSNINEGIGLPDWKLTLFLLLAWCCIAAILSRGIKSSGKASYFLALFPYAIMITLLIRAVTLKGAVNGILYFIKPDWKKLLEAKVWYHAVVQCFFSLAICFGDVIMYASYNNFRHNIYRDVWVITTLDTLTSLLAGFTIFSILGNLAYELNINDISQVVRSGAGLAFISYPDAISKFTFLPQVFSALFFLMLFVLGIGSVIGIVGAVINIVHDQFPNWKHWHLVIIFSVTGFSIGTIYCTPGGQFILTLVDYYAASFIGFFLAIFEVIGVFWIYGFENFLDDVEYMLNRRPSVYWRISWMIISPLMVTVILIYTIITFVPLTYAGASYPPIAHSWLLFAIGIIQIPFWLIYTIYTYRHLGFPNMVTAAFKPSKKCRPLYHNDINGWEQFKEVKRQQRMKRTCSKAKQFFYILFGQEKKLS